MKWMFAPNHGGRASGFHDAGVETFKGNFDRYLARELIQNSLDARLDQNKPVEVVFSLKKLNQADIPDVSSLKVAFERSQEYWPHDKKASTFFEQASDLAKSSFIDVLCVGDFNTHGVLGSDTEREKNWFNLIRSAGSSSKGGGEGGSFGIGKNAPFAASKMRTVFYSTLNSDKEYIFQGVAMLVTHCGNDGSEVQPVGYLGNNDGLSIRKKGEIPPIFLRNKTGTDISILGFDTREHWQEDLVYSVLDNFWPAIEFGDLEVTVGNQTINKVTLPQLLQEYSGQEDFTAHLYYEAYKNPSHPTLDHELSYLKSVNLYLRVGEKELPKRIVMVRKTGMKIFEKSFRSVVPFCGVFVCRNDEGNKKLRDMEPPRHDIWDPDYPEKGSNKKIESEYVTFIRSRIKELAPIEDVSEISVPGLNRYLPDDDDMADEKFDSTDEPSQKESFTRNTLPERIEGQISNPKKQKMQADHTRESLDGDGLTGTGDGDIEVPRSGSNSNDTTGGNKNNPGDTYNDSTDTVGGKTGGSNSKPSIPIHYRTFLVNRTSGVYRVAVKPEANTDGLVELVFWIVGDDQKVESEIQHARLVSGEDIPIINGHSIGPVSLTSDGIQVEVILKTPHKVAMEVVAHEVI